MNTTTSSGQPIHLEMNKPISFSKRLRVATAVSHRRAEKTIFVRGFLRGTASLPGYCRLLTDLYPVYVQMEKSLATLTQSHAQIALFDFPQLHRGASLERDLELIAGPRWREQWQPSPASLAYVERIKTVVSESPHQLIGHLYTRYLGDLSGGQILARIAGRSLGLTIDRGLSFYHFSDIPNLAAMKTLFRSRLDEVALSAPHFEDSIINEANRAFDCNIAIFKTLRGNALVSFLRNLPIPFRRPTEFPQHSLPLPVHVP